MNLCNGWTQGQHGALLESTYFKQFVSFRVITYQHFIYLCHLCRNLRLINENVNVMSPNDVAFVSSGYAPMSVRLVQFAIQPGWATVYGSTLQLLPRPALEFSQGIEAASLNIKEAESRLQRQEKATINASQPQPSQGKAVTVDGDKKIMICYYIGGVTFMEIAALRFLSAKPDFPFRIIVCTTKVVNGNTLLKTLLQTWE